MKYFQIPIGDSIRLVSEDTYNKMVKWATYFDANGNPITDWDAAFKYMEKVSASIAPIRRDEDEPEY